MKPDMQMFYVMLALPTLFGLTLVGDGIFKLKNYDHGWGSIATGTIFLMVVAFGFFYLVGQ